jgi:hypothetical protein
LEESRFEPKDVELMQKWRKSQNKNFIKQILTDIIMTTTVSSIVEMRLLQKLSTIIY